jgi:ribosome biogenesis protein Nip4
LQDGKTRRLTYSPANATETQRIQKGLATYVPESDAQKIIGGGHLIIGKGRRHEVFFITDPLWELFQKVKPLHPYFSGRFLGELKGQQFQPSLHILQHLADNSKPAAKVTLSASDEQRFLYGHSLDAQEYVPDTSQLEAKLSVIVVNKVGDGLGYGSVEKTPEGPTLKNKQDLGWYLRRGQ